MTAEELAKSIREAYNKRQAIDPIRVHIGTDDIALAYEIQNINTQIRIDQGARVIGKKIGITSPVVQKQLGVNQPDFGILFQDKEILNGQSIDMSELMQAKVEAEIAFVLGEDLDYPDMTITDVIGAIDYALPAIEVVGSRIKDWDIKITDTIADNASASHYVVGHTPRTLDEFDVVNCEMSMMKNAEVVSQGTGAACLGSPLNAVLWLANQMQSIGNPLMAGELILSGALGPMCEVKTKDNILAEIEGLGSVSVSFE